MKMTEIEPSFKEFECLFLHTWKCNLLLTGKTPFQETTSQVDNTVDICTVSEMTRHFGGKTAQ